MRSRSAAFLLISLISACADEVPDEPERPESPPVTASVVTATPRRAMARRAENYLLNYGQWEAGELAIARNHDLVVVDPDETTVTRALVADLQAAGVLVVCYISIGEDQRSAGDTDAELAADPRYRGDGTGPRVDPRGPDADGQPLTGIAPLGAPSPGGAGYASYYVDDNDRDGVPDRNGNFGGRFTNAGDPKWFDALQGMTAAADRVSGLREILTTSYGKGLGCDGVFLDTFDTAAPNAWTDSSSANQSEFEWTAPGFGAFLTRLRAAYPDIVVIQNRGLFFFDPRNPQFAFIPRGQLDFVLYESFRLNSASSNNPDSFGYPNNRFQYAPKLAAEAGRSDGFQVLSLGYAEGPSSSMNELTLVGQSTVGYDSLLEDIRVTERLCGFRHYLTNSSVTLVNEFVADHADRSDHEPPVWTSTYNDGPGYPTPPIAPTPRIGIQQVLAGQAALTVRWDVAQDLHEVGYALYYGPPPLDFATATRVVLDGRPPSNYTRAASGIYANEATIGNLVQGQTYALAIRAFDTFGHEDTNQVVLTGTPGGAGPYLGDLGATNTDTTVTYRARYGGTWTWRRVYIDRDRVTGTGWNSYGIGADFLIEEGRLYRYTGSGTSWSWSYVQPAPLTVGSSGGLTTLQWDLPASAIGPTTATRLVFQIQKTGEANTSAVVEHAYTTTGDGAWVSNDATSVRLHTTLPGTYSYKHVFIDDDSNAATGYAVAGIGAGYMIENGSLYRWVGPGWAFTKIGSSNYVGGAAHDWTVSRSLTNSATGTPRWTVVFQANGGPPAYVSPPYVHAFTL